VNQLQTAVSGVTGQGAPLDNRLATNLEPDATNTESAPITINLRITSAPSHPVPQNSQGKIATARRSHCFSSTTPNQRVCVSTALYPGQFFPEHQYGQAEPQEHRAGQPLEFCTGLEPGARTTPYTDSEQKKRTPQRCATGPKYTCIHLLYARLETGERTQRINLCSRVQVLQVQRARFTTATRNLNAVEPCMQDAAGDLKAYQVFNLGRLFAGHLTI